MKVFVTGASGFIGSAVVQELREAGHHVLGLARSESAAQALVAAGAQVHRGDVEDLESLKRGAAAADGVIHLAFVHDSARNKEACEIDRRAIEAISSVLVGTQRRFVAACGLTVMTPGRLRTENDSPVSSAVVPRAASEEAANAAAALGVNTSLIRLPPMVHDQHKQGLGIMMFRKAREAGFSAYVGDGQNRWPAVHRLDAARLFRLALEKGVAQSRYHAIGEEGIALQNIATVIGKRVNVPVVSKSADEAAAHFGWFAQLVKTDAAASSAQTQAQLGWRPMQVGLIGDLENAIL